jgi:hypothetical protein
MTINHNISENFAEFLPNQKTDRNVRQAKSNEFWPLVHHINLNNRITLSRSIHSMEIVG